MSSSPYDRVAGLYDLYNRYTADIPFYLEEVKGVRGRVLELMAAHDWLDQVSFQENHHGIAAFAE